MIALLGVPWLDHGHCKDTGHHLCSRLVTWWLVGHGPEHLLIGAMIACALGAVLLVWLALRVESEGT